MNSEAIESILSEMLEEIKDLNKNQECFTATLESFAENISNFENLLNQITVEVAPTDLKPIENLINMHLSRINTSVKNQPKEVLHEKRILFYPEGDGKNFLKLIVKRLILMSSIVLISYFALSFWFDSFKENAMYKRIFEYAHFENGDRTKLYLDELKADFENDSIKEFLINEMKQNTTE